MSHRSWWLGGFLTVTALALGAELVAALDNSPATVPWTELLTDLPWWVTMPAALALSVWLPIHLAIWYRRRRTGNPTPRRHLAMTTSVPPSTDADARNRAARTFAQGLLTDVVGAVVLAVGPALAGSDFTWSRAYWTAVGGLAAKTVVMSAVSYIARHLKPPAVG